MSSDRNSQPEESELPQDNTPAGGPEERERQRRILIGSQRDPDRYRPKPKRDWIPVEGQGVDQPAAAKSTSQDTSQAPAAGGSPRGSLQSPDAPAQASPATQAAGPAQTDAETPETPEQIDLPAVEADLATGGLEPRGHKGLPPPNIRQQLPPELENELNAAMGGVAMDDLLASGESLTKQPPLEPDTRHTGRVVAVSREDVFVELGSREQGIVPLRMFAAPPEPGTQVEVIVVRYSPADGLYELITPHGTASVSDWSDLREGMLVEVRVTGHNVGGLECEVNHIRGFIPVSQVSLYRVEDLAQFVGEKLTCVVTEADPDRQNLVLSRRAVLERERESARQELLSSLSPGQLREGVVRKLTDFGAFVDLGGVDGLIHISQLGWGRVAHPRDVLSEGQTVKVRIEKVDRASRRISLGYREMLPNPWQNADKKFPVNSVVKGKVAKLMEFGAFVELEPGVEGLVHISELSHRRVVRSSDVVHEGEVVDVLIKSVDMAAQRISLSMKDVLPPPEAEKEESAAQDPAKRSKKASKRPQKPLQGGLGFVEGGDRFGLKW